MLIRQLVHVMAVALLLWCASTPWCYGDVVTSGIYPRIVINDSIGPAGSRAFAAPFHAVVS